VSGGPFLLLVSVGRWRDGPLLDLHLTYWRVRYRRIAGVAMLKVSGGMWLSMWGYFCAVGRWGCRRITDFVNYVYNNPTIINSTVVRLVAESYNHNESTPSSIYGIRRPCKHSPCVLRFISLCDFFSRHHDFSIGGWCWSTIFTIDIQTCWSDGEGHRRSFPLDCNAVSLRGTDSVIALPTMFQDDRCKAVPGICVSAGQLVLSSTAEMFQLANPLH